MIDRAKALWSIYEGIRNRTPEAPSLRTYLEQAHGENYHEVDMEVLKKSADDYRALPRVSELLSYPWEDGPPFQNGDVIDFWTKNRRDFVIKGIAGTATPFAFVHEGELHYRVKPTFHDLPVVDGSDSLANSAWINTWGEAYRSAIVNNLSVVIVDAHYHAGANALPPESELNLEATADGSPG